LRKTLRRRAARLGLQDRIVWRGAQSQERVLAAYREADIFLLANRVARNGDRDGLPNVLMEALSQELACVASSTAAVPELIADGSTGLLVPPEEPARLADAIVRLAGDPSLRRALGRAGAEAVRTKFAFAAGIAELRRLFPAEHEPAPQDVACASPSTRH
jgi:glycosyltransferase involved in cell wall biosynthesis